MVTFLAVLENLNLLEKIGLLIAVLNILHLIVVIWDKVESVKRERQLIQLKSETNRLLGLMTQTLNTWTARDDKVASLMWAVQDSERLSIQDKEAIRSIIQPTALEDTEIKG